MIPYANLAAQHAAIRPELEAVIADVMFGSEFTLGRHVTGFEAAFARYCGAAYGVGVNSGTSALHLALVAYGIGPGDEVVTTAFSFVATAAAIVYAGARPILVDVDPTTLTIDPTRLERAVSSKTRAVVPVHLYGQPADMEPLRAFADRHGLVVIEDAAQAHGAVYCGRPVGSLGHAACFSFYPGKNLGAVGDAGMVLTSDAEVASRLRRLRDWGQSATEPLGRAFNARMAAIQAAVLAVKLRHLDSWTERRRENAAQYDMAIAGPELKTISVHRGVRHARHMYALRARNRDAAIAEFRRRGIETRIHYPNPIHLWEGSAGLGYQKGSFPAAEAAASQVISVPVHPELSAAQVRVIADAISAISVSHDHPRLSAPGMHTQADKEKVV